MGLIFEKISKIKFTLFKISSNIESKPWVCFRNFMVCQRNKLQIIDCRDFFGRWMKEGKKILKWVIPYKKPWIIVSTPTLGTN